MVERGMVGGEGCVMVVEGRWVERSGRWWWRGGWDVSNGRMWEEGCGGWTVDWR